MKISVFLLKCLEQLVQDRARQSGIFSSYKHTYTHTSCWGLINRLLMVFGEDLLQQFSNVKKTNEHVSMSRCRMLTNEC